MSTPELACWNCGADLKSVPRPISRHEQCPDCFEALHCCRLCRHYRTDVTGQCDEDRADPPVVKENANFCDWFRPSAGAFSGARVNRADAAKDQLQALFGSSADAEPPAGETDTDTGNQNEEHSPGRPASPEEEARARLNDLFGKD
jgi:hypothetical protein